MKKLVMKIFGIKCNCEFTPPPPFIFPTVDAPEQNRCQYYAYMHMGGNWYGRKFYCNGNVFYIQLDTAPQLGVWMNTYPMAGENNVL